MDAPVIAIRREGVGFVVALEPDDPAHPPRHFDNQRSAFGWAGGMRMTTGWRKLDLTGGTDGKRT
jgi:hypothetical protein